MFYFTAGSRGFIIVSLFIVILNSLILIAFSFNGGQRTVQRRCSLQMKWSFSSVNQGGMSTPGGGGRESALQEIVGSEGEIYYSPMKVAKLKAPVEYLGKSYNQLPLFPSTSSVLVPLGTEMLNCFEMRHRQLLTDVNNNDGLFGFSYLQNQKLGLVGTLARIKSRKLLEDGRFCCVVEGVGRFYIKEVVGEKPYLKAKVQCFDDYTESPTILDALETNLYNDVRFNVKLMHLLMPTKTYKLNQLITQFKPQSPSNTRVVRLTTDKEELDRRSKLSFAMMDVLQISQAVKLSLLQEHVIEKRLMRIQKLLMKGGAYLTDTLKSKGVVTDEGLRQIRAEVIAEVETVESAGTANVAENFDSMEGSWVQMPLLF